MRTTLLPILLVTGVSMLGSTAQAADCEVWSRAENRCIKEVGAPSLADAAAAARAKDVPVVAVDLPPSPGDLARSAAIASLRAVSSVLAGGANTQEFKTYYFTAKVQVDALPVTDANAALRKISDSYADAITLLIASRLKSLSASEVSTIEMKHRDIPRFMENVPSRGFGGQLPTARNDRVSVFVDVAAIWVGAAAQALLSHADSQLAALP